MFPKPSANKEEYEKILKKRFEVFPVCKENYEKYLKYKKEGYTVECNCLPIKMDYEVSNHCNFRCTMCLISEENNSHSLNMNLEDFKRSIDLQKGLIEVKLQGLGEPLLNTDFFEMVDYAVSHYIWVRTTTNASLLHIHENYKKMIDTKIGEIQISVDGASKETFEKIRRGSDFDLVVDNCKLLNRYASSKGEQWRTSCWMLVQKDNVNEVEKLLELASEMGFTRLTYSLAINDWNKENWKEINKGKEIFDFFTGELVYKLIQRGKELGIEVTFWDGKDKYIYDDKANKICDWLFSRAFISADMRIVPCCVICDSNTYDLGDANNFTIEWNNKDYRGLRQMHLEGNIPNMCIQCYTNRNK